MKESQSKPDNLKNIKIIFMINRETGEFKWLDNYYILDTPSNIVFLIKDDIPIPVCMGHYDQNIWYFKGKGHAGSHADRFVAAINALDNISGNP
jgi:hypothetical protein